jgi:hypothetical protein
MTANLQRTDRELWKLIDRVRDAGYGWFTLEEKTWLHNLVVRLKATRRISSDDLQLASPVRRKLVWRRGAYRDVLTPSAERRRKMKATPPLLLLAAGRKVRARKAPVARPKESKLQCDVAEVLRCHALPTWRWSHFPAGEKRDIITGARLKRYGLQSGWPDLILASPSGQLHCLELKRIGETLSDAQNDFRLWCISHGVPHSVAFTFDEALAALDHWGCLRILIGGAT